MTGAEMRDWIVREMVTLVAYHRGLADLDECDRDAAVKARAHDRASQIAQVYVADTELGRGCSCGETAEDRAAGIEAEGDLSALIHKVAARVADGDEATAIEAAVVVREALAQRGLKAGCHCSDSGAKVTLTPEQTVEWYAGQFVQIVDHGAWYAMNAWINLLDKYVPEAERG